ncbi:MAG: Abi family protein [Muribaculaceae bacterium]|nr:Abi family protein [Muribaculaceae bacterium]
MGRKAKPIEEQIRLLQKRGMRVDDPRKATEILLEIGWFRMSLYWFPFETRYPDMGDSTHRFRDGTTFRDALLLYAFDFNLRHMLLKPLERIETAFRTYMIFHVSTRYPDSPAWFADRKVVGAEQAKSFERVIYNPLKRQNAHIMLHHRRFPKDKFAPAWKTLEFMTLGTMCNLYESLTSSQLRQDIARHFGVHQEGVFTQYMDVIRSLRNLCAHGNVLYSFRPPVLRRGPAWGGQQPPCNLAGALGVMEHFLGMISPRLTTEYRDSLSSLLHQFTATPGTRHVLSRISGFRLKEKNNSNTPAQSSASAE